MNALPEYVEIIEGQKPGPSVVVMGAVHGDERIGAAVIEALREKIRAADVHGTLTLILGNPAAYAADTRCVDVDLNRQFGPDFDGLGKKDPTSLNTEERRALAIAPLLKGAAYLLDIHATGKLSRPFVYCESTPLHRKLAALFGVRYVVSPSPDDPSLSRSATDNYVDCHGGVGITYEAGCINDPSPIEEVLKRTYAFLTAVGCLSPDGGEEVTGEEAPVYVEIYEEVIPQTTAFKFKKDFSNFHVLKAGDVFATEGGTEIAVKEDSYMVFPKVDIVPGKPACYLARLKTH